MVDWEVIYDRAEDRTMEMLNKLVAAQEAETDTAGQTQTTTEE